MALAHKFPKMCLQCQSWIWLCRNFLQERKMFSLSLHLEQFALGWETERLVAEWTLHSHYHCLGKWRVASSDCPLLSSSSVNNCAWEAWHWACRHCTAVCVLSWVYLTEYCFREFRGYNFLMLCRFSIYTLCIFYYFYYKYMISKFFWENNQDKF